MHSILSLLDDKNIGEIQEILTAIRPAFPAKTPIIWKYPHFTWHSAEEYNPALLVSTLKAIANNYTSFHIRVTGMGLFTGKTRVLFLPILKTCDLVNMQMEISSQLNSLSKKPSEFYDPKRWIPHITLISSQEDQDSIGPAIQILGNLTVDFELAINNISSGEYTGEAAKIFQEYPLG
jgi:2'-5' RNA ligase